MTPASILRQALGAGLLGLCLLPAAGAGTLTGHDFTARSYAGSRDRGYQVYVPDGLSGPAPLVMVLHGCAQTDADVLSDWGLKEAAERHGFILVAPFVTSWEGQRGSNCWGFWLPEQRQRGKGEAEDLYQIAREVEQQQPVDPTRRYVTGLSSGGAMTAVLAVTHNDYWAAAATAAGLAYGEDAAAVSTLGFCPGWSLLHDPARVAADMGARLGEGAYPMPLMVIQNNRDCTVKQPAGAILRDAQLALYGAPGHRTAATTQAAETDCAPVFGQGFGCRHTRYTSNGQPTARSLAETVFYDGPLVTPSLKDTDLGHYWVGGADGRDGPYAVRQGPAYPEIIWDFFARHPRDDSQVRFDRAPPTCRSATASPLAHLTAGRARLAAWGTRVRSSGDQQDLGWSGDWWSSVRLHQGPADLWFSVKPAACR